MLIKKKHKHDRRGSYMKVTEMLAGSLMNYSVSMPWGIQDRKPDILTR